MPGVFRECLGLECMSRDRLCHKFLAFLVEWLVRLCGGLAPCTAARLLRPCAVQQADFALVKASLPAIRRNSAD